jgi:hypothetical protein
MIKPSTPSERIATYRQRKKAAGLVELRNRYVKPEWIPEIDEFITSLENAVMKKVITYQAPNGETIDLTEQEISEHRSAGTWPKNSRGEEYCTVSHGLHTAEDECEEN